MRRVRPSRFDWRGTGGRRGRGHALSHTPQNTALDSSGGRGLCYELARNATRTEETVRVGVIGLIRRDGIIIPHPIIKKPAGRTRDENMDRTLGKQRSICTRSLSHSGHYDLDSNTKAARDTDTLYASRRSSCGVACARIS